MAIVSPMTLRNTGRCSKPVGREQLRHDDRAELRRAVQEIAREEAEPVQAVDGQRRAAAPQQPEACALRAGRRERARKALALGGDVGVGDVCESNAHVVPQCAKLALPIALWRNFSLSMSITMIVATMISRMAPASEK